MIKKILARLTDQQRSQLMTAFEGQFEQYIILHNGKFIGVNVRPIKGLLIEESAGVWSYGSILGEKANVGR